MISQALKRPKRSLRERETARLAGGEGTFFKSRNFGKSGHFGNVKPAVSPEARKRFLKLRNVQKLSHREREIGRFACGKENFFRSRNVEKNVHLTNSKQAVTPEARKRFLKLRTSKTGNFANGKPAVSPVARKIFSGPETAEKW